MSGIKIAALYGIYPFRLGLCGPKEKAAKTILLDFLLGKKISEKKVRDVLKQFKGAYFYYRLIAKCNNIKDPFNEKVVKAYWIGNKLLDRVPISSLRGMVINDFSGPGLLPKKITEKKGEEIPLNSKPHHSFHVFVIGSVTGTIELKGKLLDICRVSWGQVIKKEKNKIVIKYKPVKKSKNKYHLGDFIEKTIFWDKNIVPEPKKGNWVSCHWNHIVQILNKKDIGELKKYTEITLDSLNN